MKKIFALLIMTCGLVSNASAEIWELDGFYLKGFAGPNWVQAKKDHDTKCNFNTGYAVGGSIGYRFCNGLSLEGEINYRRNTVHSITNHGETIEFSKKKQLENHISFHAKGHYSELGLMANAIYGIDASCINPTWCDVTPYLGGGIGYGHEMSRLSLSLSDPEGNSIRLKGRNNKGGFAWQLIAGVGYSYSPSFDTAIEYRYYRGQDKKLQNHTLGLVAKYNF